MKPNFIKVICLLSTISLGSFCFYLKSESLKKRPCSFQYFPINDTPSFCTCSLEKSKEDKILIDVVRFAHSRITEDSIKIIIKKNLRVVYEPIANGNRDLTLIVGFTVDKNGNIRHPKVHDEDESIYPKHVAEACRVVELLPKWDPELRKNKFGKWIPFESHHSVDVYFDESLYPY